MLEQALYRTPRSRRQRAPGRRQSARRHFRNGHRAAVVRAITAARLYLDGQAPSLAAAAEACGSNVPYIRAAIPLVKSGDPSLHLAKLGWISLTSAADQVRRQHKAPESATVDEAVASWRGWTPEQRAEFGRGAGVADIWDDAISPVIAEEEKAHDAARSNSHEHR